MRLKLVDAQKASVFGLPPTDIDSDVIIAHYAGRGWKAEDVMRHIQSAIDAGAFEKVTEHTYPTRAERIAWVRKEAIEDKE